MSKMDKLLAAVTKAKYNGGTERTEEAFYYPQRDTAGNGQATIRFLPGKTDDDIPFVKLYSHGFKGPTGKWLIDECPTTIDKPCYVCEQNGELWNTNIKANQDIVRERKRRVSYVANILVVEDKKTPENEGKVFLYKFGSKIFDKIVDVIQPDDEDDKPCNVFDLVEGANFKLKIRKVDGQTNYDKSEFLDPSECDFSALDTLEDLSKFLSPDKFKSEEELKRRFNAAVGNTDRLASKDKVQEEEVDVPKGESKAPRKENTKTPPKEAVDSLEDDDIEALMKRLAESD